MKVCLKQFGEKRTGTNFVRALLLANYPDVVPLMHVLGDKHLAPLDLCRYLENAEAAPDPAWEFIRAATLAAPAEYTRADDPEQIRYLRGIAEAVTHAVRSGELGFILSTKHPYAWAASLARYSGWMIWQNGTPRMAPYFREPLADACRVFNQVHCAWWEHHRRFESRSIIVRHEDLIRDPRGEVARLESRFQLNRVQPELKLFAGQVLPTDWDHCPPRIDARPFDPEFYRRRGYAPQLSQDVWDMVENTIDWQLAAEFGYSPRDIPE